MLYFPSQNDKKVFFRPAGCTQKNTQVTANQHIFKSGLNKFLISRMAERS